MKTLIQIFWICALALIALLSRAAQPFTPLLVVDSVNTLVTRTPTTGESIVVLGQAAAYDSAPRIARNFPAGTYTVDGVDNFAAVNGTIWHLNWLSSGVNINGTTAGGIVNGTNVLWITSGTNAQAYITGYQTTNAALNALIAGNGAGLTNVQPSAAALTNLANNPSLYQATNTALTTVVNGGTTSNFFRGDKVYAQVTTNDVPALNTHVSNLQSAITARQVASAALTNLAGGDGSALTNVARIGLGQPEVSGVAFDGTSSTRVAGPMQVIGTNDFSVWIRTRVPTASTSKGLFAISTNSGTYGNGQGFVMYGVAGQDQLWLEIDGATASDYNVVKTPLFYTTYGGTIADIVATRSGTNVAVYINGTAQTLTSATSGTPPTWAGYLNGTFAVVGAYSSSTVWPTPIYRTAVFNRALSAADVQSLVKNGIDPSDQWGNSTVPVVSYNPSTLNGGFETNSLNAAGTWATTVVGGSTATIDTTGTNSHSGSNAMRLGVDASENFSLIYANNGANFTVAGARYRVSYWGKYGVSSTGTPRFRVECPSGTVLMTNTFTSSYQQFVSEFTSATSSTLSIIRHNSSASSTNYIDDVELTRIGAVLDLDFTTGGGTNVFDRSSNSLTATNYGGVSWTLPLKGQYIAGNATVASNLTVAGTITGTVAGYQTTNAQLTTLINNSGANLTNVAMRGLGQPEVSGVAFDGTTGTRTLGLAQALGTNTYSVWARVQVPSATSSSSRCIFGLSTNAASAALSTGGTICYIASDDALYFQQYGATTSDSRYKYITGFRTNYSGQIVDLVVVNSKSDVAIYLNGVTASTSEGSAGTRPPWTDATASAYFRVGSTADSGGGAGVWTTPIYRTAIFNRALSQADVTSLINNGIDPADEFGSQTAAFSNDFSTTVTNFTAAGSGTSVTLSSGRMLLTFTNAVQAGAYVNSYTMQPNKNYRVSFTHRLNAGSFSAQNLHDTSQTPGWTALTGSSLSYTSTTNDQVAVIELKTDNASAARIPYLKSVASAINSALEYDNFAVNQIGAILDLDFTTGYGTNVWDRSSNSLNATNYGGVSWTMPVNAINTGTLRATNLTATYISGDGSAITSMGATNQNQLVTLAQLESFTANGLHMFFYGSSNAVGINSGAAVHTNWAYSTASSSAAVTNTVASPTNSQYLCEFVSNDTFTQFASGVVNIEMWMFFNSGGSRAVSVLAEAYIYDSVGGTNYLEITPAAAAQDLTGTLTKYLYSIPIPDITPPNASRLVVKFKVGSVASTPTVSMVSQGVYTSHAAFSVPLSSYVLKTGDTMTGTLTVPTITVSSNILQTALAIAPASAATNVVLNFGNSMLTYQVTNNVFFYQSTNRPSSATTFLYTIIRLRGDTTNRLLGFNTSWSQIGTAVTTIPSNKVVLIDAISFGSSETNVTVEARVQP